MDVVAIDPDLKEHDLVAVADVNADTPQNCLHLIGDDRTAVLGRADRTRARQKNKTNKVTKQASGNCTLED